MRSIVYIIILLIVAGCSYSGSQMVRGLDEAEALMLSDPGAAMERLNGYDISEFNDSALMARWALLYSAALVANRITVPSDTIVNIAVDYYGRKHQTAEFQYASRLKVLLKSSGNNDALVTALYLQKEKEFMLYKERMRREQYIFTSIIIFLIAGGIIIWQRQRLKLKDAQNEALIAQASSLTEGLRHNESVCSEMQLKLERLLSRRFDVIDCLCETYYESQGTKVERKAIVEKVKEQIEELKSDSGLFSEMERCIRECRPGLIEAIQDSWPEMKADDYRLIVYLSCNLSNRSIAALLGKSIDIVYKRKSRLKARLASLNLRSDFNAQ